MGDPIRINGFEHTYASAFILIGDNKYYGIKEITYGDKIEAPMGYSLGPAYAPSRQGVGKYSCDNTTMKVYRRTAHAIREALAALSPVGAYGLAYCLINITTTEIFDGVEQPYVVLCERSRLLEEKATIGESPESLEEDLSFSTMAISRNGKYKFNVTQGF